MTTKRNSALVAAWIGGICAVIAAFVGLLPTVLHKSPNELVVAGTVVDELSNLAIPQANIHLAGRSETYVTEDNGNFRVEIGGPVKDGFVVRLHVTKDGYRPYDGSARPPVENLIISLRRLK
jgi:hypothetical protein